MSNFDDVIKFANRHLANRHHVLSTFDDRRCVIKFDNRYHELGTPRRDGRQITFGGCRRRHHGETVLKKGRGRGWSPTPSTKISRLGGTSNSQCKLDRLRFFPPMRRAILSPSIISLGFQPWFQPGFDQGL